MRAFCVLLILLSAQVLGGESLFDPEILYLTWDSCPESSITINWVTNSRDTADTIFYKLGDGEDWEEAQGKHTLFPERGRTTIHRTALNNLFSDTIYCFKIGKEGKVFKFKTLPDTLQKPLSFIVGGDMYHDSLEILEHTNSLAAKYNPSFVLIGGDIAYAASSFKYISQNSRRWIDWLKAWKKTMVTQDGLLIPLLAVPGNHDVTGRYRQSKAEAKIFYALFVPNEQSANRVIDFGNYFSLFLLDSDHTSLIENQQDWLGSALEARESVPHKMAIYHVPAYPSIRDFNNTVSQKVRKYWVPLFEKYGLQTAFENHDHSYKRTYPLLKNKIDPKGILYIGDGAWGVKKPRTDKSLQKKTFLAKYSPCRHFILATIDPQYQIFQAIDDRNKIFDSTIQEIELLSLTVQ